MLDAEFFGLAVDAFARRSLGGNGLVKGTAAIEKHAGAASWLVVDIADAASAFHELLMLADLVGG